MDLSTYRLGLIESRVVRAFEGIFHGFWEVRVFGRFLRFCMPIRLAGLPLKRGPSLVEKLKSQEPDLGLGT